MAEGGVGVGEPLRLVAAVVELGDGAGALGLIAWMSARRRARRASSQYWAMMWRTRSLAWRRRRSSAREAACQPWASQSSTRRRQFHCLAVRYQLPPARPVLPGDDAVDGVDGLGGAE